MLTLQRNRKKAISHKAPFWSIVNYAETISAPPKFKINFF